jgi:cytochrome-b5 reductase
MEATLLSFCEANKGIIIGAGLVVGVALLNLFWRAGTEVAVLTKDVPKKFKLIEKKSLVSGEGILPVNLYRFEITGKRALGLPVGQHIYVSTTLDGEEVKRAYTPTSNNNTKGHFDLVIKIYPAGKMGNFIDKLKIGDSIDVTGPKGEFTYEKNKYTHLGMLAGGTGITPCLQIIDEISRHSDDKTKVSLLYGNLTENDIILREKIEEYAKSCPNITVYHVLNKPPQGWKQGEGFITPDMITKFCPAPGQGKILMCGPPPMIGAMMKNCTTLGYTKTELFNF